MALMLGEDGRGYELARRLEGCGAWRAWLGDAGHAALLHALASPAAWDAFMSPRSAAPLSLQLRARSLLFDKASAALFLRSPSSSTSLSEINPSYLQLHGDDIYFSLEDLQGGARNQAQLRSSLSPCKANENSYERASSVGLRYIEPENANTLQRHRHDELPDSWYSQFVEKYRASNYKFTHGDKESNKRTPEGMSTYLRLEKLHKRKRPAFKEQSSSEIGPSMHQRNISTEEDLFFPELMFPSNCVPDSALPPTNGLEENQKVEFFGVLDNLPTVASTSSAMIERFGIMPEYVKVGTKFRGKDGSGGNRKSLSQEQAAPMTRKVVARLLATSGFEGGTEASMEVFSEFVGRHIFKLGCKLKLLTDSYRKQYSSIEVLKMFLQTAECSNVGVLLEVTKNVNKGFPNKTQQHVRALQTQQQNSLLQAQQFQRQMLQPQNMAFHQQQQWEKMRRRQASIPRGPVMGMEKEQPMMEVKLENMTESPPLDSTFNNLSKHQLQLRHQQLSMANQHVQASQQFKQLPPNQIPHLQAQGPYGMRAQPVKVEAFHELVGTDPSVKLEADHNKLTPPSK